MTRLEYLNRQRDMAYHNLRCASGNASITKPKVGEEDYWKEAKEICCIVEEMIAETMGKAKGSEGIFGAMVIDGKVVHNWEQVLSSAEAVAGL